MMYIDCDKTYHASWSITQAEWKSFQQRVKETAYDFELLASFLFLEEKEKYYAGFGLTAERKESLILSGIGLPPEISRPREASLAKNWFLNLESTNYAWEDKLVYEPLIPHDSKLVNGRLVNYYEGCAPSTARFRRFDRLLNEGYEDPPPPHILTQAFLGLEGYIEREHYGCILNDDWTVNLRQQQKEKPMHGINITEELKDILKVYEDAEKHLQAKETAALDLVTSYMKRFIEAQEKREEVSKKLKALKIKMENPTPIQEKDEEDECT